MCGFGKMKSPWKSYEGKKKFYKEKRLGHQMMYGEAIWKYGTGEIAKPSSAITPEPHKKVGWRGEGYSARYEPPAA